MSIADAMLWKQNIHTALSVISRHTLFCFLSLILAASATKWLYRFGLQRITTLQSPLSPFHLGPARSMRWTSQERDSICLFKCSRQLSGCHPPFIYTAGRGYTCMCVSRFKITFRASDGCVPDCWVAARLKSSPPTSPARFLSLSRASVSRDGEVGKSCEWYTSQPERDEKDLPFPVKRGRCKARGYAHWNAIFCSSLLHSSPYLGDRDEKCALWKMAPITGLTPADLCSWPPHLISVNPLLCLNLFTLHTYMRVRMQKHSHPSAPFFLPRVLLD